MPDLTRKKDFAQKKTMSVASARVTHDMVAATTLQELFNLPPNAVIVEAMVNVVVAGQANLTVDFGFDGGNELGNDLDIDGIAVVSVGHNISSLTLTEAAPNTYLAGSAVKVPRIATGTGKTVTAKFSADPSAGEFIFIVSFIEFDLTNGQLMQLGDG